MISTLRIMSQTRTYKEAYCCQYDTTPTEIFPAGLRRIGQS